MLPFDEMLAQIRLQAIALAQESWPELGVITDQVLPNPLDPIALLPVATGLAVGGATEPLVPLAAAITLVNIALRIQDDCADDDEPTALHRTLGTGQAMNIALGLSTSATRQLARLALDSELTATTTNQTQKLFLDAYCHAFLQVCAGQDKKGATNLVEYQQIVRLKTVAAYEYATKAGAMIARGTPAQIQKCSECGQALGWMAQILDDLEALWFPAGEHEDGGEEATAARFHLEKMTYPTLFALTLSHPKGVELQELLQTTRLERKELCQLLDQMEVRPQLLSLALDYRDAALESLSELASPVGRTIIEHWLNWLLRDAARLLASAV